MTFTRIGDITRRLGHLLGRGLLGLIRRWWAALTVHQTFLIVAAMLIGNRITTHDWWRVPIDVALALYLLAFVGDDRLKDRRRMHRAAHEMTKAMGDANKWRDHYAQLLGRNRVN